MKLSLINPKQLKDKGLDIVKSIIKKKNIIKNEILEKIDCKKNLLKLIYNYNFDHSILYVQSLVRKKLAQNNLKDLKAKTIDLSKEYNNDSTLIGDELKDVPAHYLFKHAGYVFDLRELYQNYETNYKLINPYTNLEFPDDIKKQILRLSHKLIDDGYEIDLEDSIPEKYKISLLFSNFYCKMEESYCYVDSRTFNNYTIDDLYYFVKNVLRSLIAVEIFKLRLNRIADIFERKATQIDRFYYYSYVINNALKNPFINHTFDNNASIANNFEITERDYQHYVSYDKKHIEDFISICFEILNKILSHPVHGRTAAIVINEYISDNYDVVIEPITINWDDAWV